MHKLSYTAKPNPPNSSKFREKKPKKANVKKNAINNDEWAFLEWESVDNQEISMLE